MANLQEILEASDIQTNLDFGDGHVKVAEESADTSVNLDKDSIEKLAEVLDALGEEDSIIDEMAKIAVLKDMLDVSELTEDDKTMLKEAGLILPPFADREPDLNRFKYLAERLADGEALLPAGESNE